MAKSVFFLLVALILTLVLTPSVKLQEVCEPGYKYAVPEKCSAYRMCIRDDSGVVWEQFNCPDPTVFCEDVQDCTSEDFCPCEGTPIPTTTTETVTTTTEDSCTSQGEPGISFSQASFGDNWYTFVWEPQLSWDEAVEACARNCSALTSIWTVEEFQFLAGLIDQATQTRAWVGGTDFDRPEYQWIENDLRIPDAFWRPSQPDGIGNGLENCVEATPPVGGLNDLTCTIPLPFICKF